MLAKRILAASVVAVLAALGGCATTVVAQPAPPADGASVCTAADIKYADDMGHGPAIEAYDFARKLQRLVEARDLKRLYDLADDAPLSGPRRKAIAGKSFDDVFPEESRRRVLDDTPDCQPVGYRGFMIGHGAIWYVKRGDDWRIFSLPGANEEPLPQPAWEYNGLVLTRACFADEWASSDNYDTYVSHYRLDQGFYVRPGSYFGATVPLRPITPSWSGDHNPSQLALAIPLASCLARLGTKDAITLNREGWIEMPLCEEIGYVPDDRGIGAHDPDVDLDERCWAGHYRMLRQISRSHCKRFLPDFPESACIELRLLEVSVMDGGSAGDYRNASIFAIVEDPTDRQRYVVPLIHLGNSNEALSYVEALE